MHALVADSNGVVTKEAFSSFSIVNSTVGLPVVSVGVVSGVETEGAFIQKDLYHTTDLLQVQTRIVNDSLNTLFSESLTETEVAVSVLVSLDLESAARR